MMEDRPNKRKRDSERVITEVEKKDATLFIKTLQRRINMFTPKVPKLVELNRKDDPSFEGKAIDPTAPADHHWAAHTSFILDGVQRTFLADTWFHSRLEAKVTVARLVDEFLDDYDKELQKKNRAAESIEWPARPRKIQPVLPSVYPPTRWKRDDLSNAIMDMLRYSAGRIARFQILNIQMGKAFANVIGGKLSQVYFELPYDQAKHLHSTMIASAEDYIRENAQVKGLSDFAESEKKYHLKGIPYAAVQDCAEAIGKCIKELAKLESTIQKAGMEELGILLANNLLYKYPNIKSVNSFIGWMDWRPQIRFKTRLLDERGDEAILQVCVGKREKEDVRAALLHFNSLYKNEFDQHFQNGKLLPSAFKAYGRIPFLAAHPGAPMADERDVSPQPAAKESAETPALFQGGTRLSTKLADLANSGIGKNVSSTNLDHWRNLTTLASDSSSDEDSPADDKGDEDYQPRKKRIRSTSRVKTSSSKKATSENASDVRSSVPPSAVRPNAKAPHTDARPGPSTLRQPSNPGRNKARYRNAYPASSRPQPIKTDSSSDESEVEKSALDILEENQSELSELEKTPSLPDDTSTPKPTPRNEGGSATRQRMR